MRDRPDRAASPTTLQMPVGEDELDALFQCCGLYRRLLLAVSGGADSTALMHLAEAWNRRMRRDGPEPRLSVATVDHGLRPESRAEAMEVARAAGRLGLDHAILQWTGDKPASGVQAAARQARYRLLVREARRTGAEAILTAHTRDDQAETVLMRLARGSSVDGLAGMRAVSDLDGVALVRPLLAVPRVRLVATLLGLGATWLEDPSNEDVRFERVRLRRAGKARASLGLTDAHLALTARRLDRVRAALDRACDDFIREHAQLHDGAFCRIDADAFRQIPDEIALRALAYVLTAFGGQEEMPPLARMERLAGALATSRATATLGGCRFAIDERSLVTTREPGRHGLDAVAIESGISVVWDRRFRMTWMPSPNGSPRQIGCVVRALGAEGLRALRVGLRERQRSATDPTPQSRAVGTHFASLFAGWPRQALATVPSVWRGTELMAVPHCGQTAEARAMLPLQGVICAAFLGADRLQERPPEGETLG